MAMNKVQFKNSEMPFSRGIHYSSITGMNMKRSQITAYLLSIAGVALLAGCGGSSASGLKGSGTLGTATIGGTISGLPAGVTALLVDNGLDTIGVNANGNFSFDTKVQAGAAYNVTLFNQPTGAFCSITNATGTVDQNADAVTNVVVSCQSAGVAILHYNIGVTVSGLSTGNSVTFVNNGADPLTANANGLAVFSQTFSPDSGSSGAILGAYNVTVATSPSGQTCTLTNAFGVDAGSSFTNYVSVTATCK